MLKEDLIKTIAIYGPSTLADHLKWPEKLNSIDNFYGLTNHFQALIMANLLLNDFEKDVYNKFRKFMKSEESFWHLYRRIEDVCKCNYGWVVLNADFPHLVDCLAFDSDGNVLHSTDDHNIDSGNSLECFNSLGSKLIPPA